MPNNQLDQGAIEIALLCHFPPGIRISVLEDKAFRDRLGVSVDAVIRFDKIDVSFKRSLLFGAVRHLLAGNEISKILKDTNGRSWTLEFGGEGKCMRVSSGGTQFLMPDFTCLSADREERLAWFDREREECGVTDKRIDEWRVILESRELGNEEVDPLLSEFRFTPSYVAAAINDLLQGRTINISSLVPSDLRYYDRLVGEPAAEVRLKDFVDSVIAQRMQSRLQRNVVSGLKDVLLMSSHPWIPQTIPLGDVPREKVQELYQWLETYGDRFSQVGGIECGLAHVDKLPELEPILGRMIQHLLSDRSDDKNGRLSLTCSLIVLVEGELARTGVCRERPPFWRRLASISHASVLERAIVAGGLLPSDFHEWAMGKCGHLYYLQTYIDMRKEPRWLPDFVSSQQLKAEFVGRIAAAGHANLGKIKTPEVLQLLDGNDSNSVRSQLSIPFSFLPGPLEGGIGPVMEMPTEIEANLRIGLEAPELTPKSFAILVNFSLIYEVGSPLAKLAAEGLRRVKHQLRQIKSQEEAFSLLAGLATVAAVTRSSDLAEEVRILMRFVRRRPGIDISRADTIRIALVAAAAHDDISGWCEFVGQCLTEFAFEDMSADEARVLRDHILALRQLEPRLWETTARADAATSAFIKSLASRPSKLGS